MTDKHYRHSSMEHLLDNESYLKPWKFCDIVLKGGVTSGIVYPLAICELATAYTFKNIGGTSAGAIAAAVTAAAEFGRQSPKGGFQRVAKLPDELCEHDKLFQLFQPQPRTRRLFRLITSPLGSKRWRVLRLVTAGFTNFPLATILGALPGFLLAAAIVSLSGWRYAVGITFVILLLAIGIILSIMAAATRIAFREIPENGYGLCNGYKGPEASQPEPLTEWLDRLLNEASGRSGLKQPLTFGDLWGTNDSKADRHINLEMVTTSLTHGRPYRLPFDDKTFWLFNPKEFEQFFPEYIVAWMVEKARKIKNAERFTPLIPLPLAADLPVIVATRMSLSFPFLISAIPLYGIDSTRQKQAYRVPEKNWFSDGGITSNLPVHFFDAPLPKWPTFAINLRPFHPDYRDSQHEYDKSFLPTNNRSGIAVGWYRIDG